MASLTAENHGREPSDSSTCVDICPNSCKLLTSTKVFGGLPNHVGSDCLETYNKKELSVFVERKMRVTS